MYKLFYILVLSVIAANPFNTNAQDLLSLTSLDTVRTYKSISEALASPESVIKLNLKGKKNVLSDEELCQFINLQSLKIKKAQLTEVPEVIGSLTQLQVIDLSNNNISEIPIEITSLSNLQILRLGQNEIKTIPPEIKNLQQLKVLDLWSNNIETLPQEMTEMKNLKFIDLRVILFSQENQNKLQDMLPWVKMEFSYSCNCD